MMKGKLTGLFFPFLFDLISTFQDDPDIFFILKILLFKCVNLSCFFQSFIH